MNLFENSRNASEPGTNLVTLRKQSQFKDLQNRECITGIRTQKNTSEIWKAEGKYVGQLTLEMAAHSQKVLASQPVHCCTMKELLGAFQDS